jgi:sortase A
MKTSRSPVPRKGHGSAFLGVLEISCFAIGIACLGSFAYVQVRSALFNQIEGKHLDEAIAHRSTLPGADESVTTVRGALLGRIEIQRASISALVVEGAWDEELSKAVGRVVGTARFGEPGTVALAGHRDLHFRRLGQVRDGDTVTVTTPRATFDYLIDSTRVTDPEEVCLTTAATRGLTLITCYPFGYIGHAPKRFQVFAHQLGTKSLDNASQAARTDVEPAVQAPAPSPPERDQRLK